MVAAINKKLGDLLVDSGRITKEELAYVLRKQKDTRKKVGEILIDEKIINEDSIIEVLQVQLGLDRAVLDNSTIDEAALKMIPQALAKKHNIMPMSFKDNILSVAMSDPLNFFAMDDLKLYSGLDIKAFITSIGEIDKAIEKYYSGQNVERAAQEVSKEQEKNFGRATEIVVNEDDINNAPIVKLVDSIIRDAILTRASDIHIEPFEKYIKIRYRIDGDIQEKQRISIESLPALTTRIKILSNLNIAEKRLPQDGRMVIKMDGRDLDMRVSVLPTINGEKIVIRILNNDNFLVDKQRLGMEPEDLVKLNKIIASPYGVILVTGPTGSGKSTTLYSILNELNKGDVNIVTVEDPVEFMMEGINQVSVNVKAGLTFSAGLRSILRQDPDIVMIGEIRDTETAEIAIRAAITGHLVLSTIHTNDAPSTIVRLKDMGIQPYLIGSSVEGIIAQRLVRKICPSCKGEYEASIYEKGLLGVNKEDNLKLYKGKGCNICNSSGYLGRIGVYEIMQITNEIKEVISNGAEMEELRRISKNNGMKTIRKGCEKLVFEGITTIDELIKIAIIKD